MKPHVRSILYWLIWLALVVGLITFFIHECSAAQKGTTKGDGAVLLVKGFKKKAPAPVAAKPPTLPKMLSKALLTNRPPAVYFFAVTARNTNGISGYSAEVGFTNTSKQSMISLVWDSVSNAASYDVYQGRTNRVYNRAFTVGTNCQATFPLSPTNLVITVMGYGTNLSMTNNFPGSMSFWTGHNLTISTRRF